MIDNCSYLQSRLATPMSPDRSAPPPAAPATLASLVAGARASVTRVVAAAPEIDAVALRRLGELGFLPGEPVRLLRRGPGGREPLAVMIGETMFALRLVEAQCIAVEPAVPAAAA
jgi:ferrous iron transport protein A